MRRTTRAGRYAFSLMPDARGVRRGAAPAAAAPRSCATAGWSCCAAGSARPAWRPVAELPVTFGGLLPYNVANALAAAAAADALGIRPAGSGGPAHLRAGQRGEPRAHEPVRAHGRLALVDFAHNEAGLSGLLDVCRALAGSARRAGAQVRLALGTAGDRTDEILHNLGALAGRGADDVVICEKRHYLRGRDARGDERHLPRRAWPRAATAARWRPTRRAGARCRRSWSGRARRRGGGDVARRARARSSTWLRGRRVHGRSAAIDCGSSCRRPDRSDISARLGSWTPVTARMRRARRLRGPVLPALELLPHVVGVVDADHDHVAFAAHVQRVAAWRPSRPGSSSSSRQRAPLAPSPRARRARSARPSRRAAARGCWRPRG